MSDKIANVQNPSESLGCCSTTLKNDKVHSLKTNQEEMRDGTRFLHSNAYRRKFAFLLLTLSFLDWFLCIFSYIFPETSQTLTVSEDPNLLYELISSGTLKDAYMHGKLYSLSYFFMT